MTRAVTTVHFPKHHPRERRQEQLLAALRFLGSHWCLHQRSTFHPCADPFVFVYPATRMFDMGVRR